MTRTVVSIAAVVTGYSADLLGVSLDLDAELAIDTVKQAEVFAAVCEHYGVQFDETLRPRDLPTLGHVIGWIAGQAELSADNAPRTMTTTKSPQFGLTDPHWEAFPLDGGDEGSKIVGLSMGALIALSSQLAWRPDVRTTIWLISAMAVFAVSLATLRVMSGGDYRMLQRLCVLAALLATMLRRVLDLATSSRLRAADVVLVAADTND